MSEPSVQSTNNPDDGAVYMGGAEAWAGWAMAIPKFWLGGPQCNWPVCSLILHC